MATYRERRRRRKSWVSRLRRFLIDHRYSVAQGLLGVLALVAGLWLLSPLTQVPPVDHRELWQHSLQSDVTGPLTDEPAITVAEASLAISAKGAISGWSTQGRGLASRSRGPRIAETVSPQGRDKERGAPGIENAALALDRAFDSAAGTLDVAVYRRPGTTTWLRNAVATSLSDPRPAIAVVIDDLGLNRKATAEVIELEGPLTLAFLPYADALEEQTRAARAAGHELLLHEPMEPVGREWPGPDPLLMSQAPDEMVSRFRKHLRSFRGFVGVNNHMGSRLTADHPRMALLMAEIGHRGLLFLDSRTSAATVAVSEARRRGVPYASRDVFIDNEIDFDAIMGQLAQAERQAKTRGVAVAMGHPHEVTIEALRRWLPTLESKGFALVPISNIVARKACADGILIDPTTCGGYLAAQNFVH